MPPVFSDYKKIFMFESIKIREESIKLILKGSKEFQICLRMRNWTELSPSNQVLQIKKYPITAQGRCIYLVTSLCYCCFCLLIRLFAGAN